MSIWTRPILGGSRSRTPPSEVQIRAARIRYAGAAETQQIVSGGHFLGIALCFVGFVAATSLSVSGPPAVGAGGWSEALLVSSVVLPLLGFAATAVVATWTMPRIMRWSFDRAIVRLTRERLVASRRLRKQLPLVLTGAAFVGTLGTIAVLLLGAVFSWAIVVGMAGMAAAITGTIVTGLGLFGREGVRLVCGRCDYPMLTWRGAPPECPECANAWKGPWGARFGRRTIRRQWVALGLTLLAVFAFAMFAHAVGVGYD